MKHGQAAIQAGWALARTGVLVIMLFALAGFTVVTHLFGRSRAERITCLDNQRTMTQALMSYQMENAGTVPRSLASLRHFCATPSPCPGWCPADDETRYTYESGTGRIMCLNPAHRAVP